MPTALITGITGQDGSYLAEYLLSKGYRVVGMARLASTVMYERIQHLLDEITVIHGDLAWLLPRPSVTSFHSDWEIAMDHFSFPMTPAVETSRFALFHPLTHLLDQPNFLANCHSDP